MRQWQNRLLMLCVTFWVITVYGDPMDNAELEQKTLANNKMNNLNTFVVKVISTHPAMLALDATLDSAKAKLQSAQQPIYNPEIALETERTDINTVTFGFSQTIDWYGKRSKLQEKAIAALQTVEAQRDLFILDITTELLNTVVRYANTKKLQNISQSRTELLSRFNSLSNARQAAGDSDQAEVMLARLALAEAYMQLTESTESLLAAKQQLMALSGIMFDSDIQLPSLSILPSKDIEITSLVNNHPEVQTAQKRVLTAKATAQEINITRRADPTIGIVAGQENDETLVALQFALPLHWRNNFNADVLAAQSETVQFEMEAQDLARKTFARIQAALERYKLLYTAWNQWRGQGQMQLDDHLKLLEKLWQSGEINATDYLVQLQQSLNTQEAGTELFGKAWLSWIEWLASSNQIQTWLTTLDPSFTKTAKFRKF